MNMDSSNEPERKYPKWEAQRQLIAATISNFKTAEKRIFAHLQLDLGPWNEWPHGIATMLLSNTTLKYRERFSLTTWCLPNGCEPTMFVEWLLKRKLLRDESARQHVASLIKAYQQQELAKYTYTVIPSRATYTADIPRVGSFEPWKSTLWSGVGEPVHSWAQAQRNCKCPDHLTVGGVEAWRMQAARSMLGDKTMATTSAAAPQVKIVPMDEEPVDEPMDAPDEPDHWPTQGDAKRARFGKRFS